MSGDHNQYQKNLSYLDFECPRCGHCCKTDLARVGEVGVRGEWVGLTEKEWYEATGIPRNATLPMHMLKGIEKALKEKNG